MLEHNEFQNALSQELLELQNLEQNLEAALLAAPEGTLHVLQKQGKCPQYYKYEGREQRKYISKNNIEIAARLAQKEYDQKLRDQVKRRIQTGLQLAEEYQLPLANVYTETPDVKRKLIRPFELSDEDFVKMWYRDFPGGMNSYPNNSDIYSNNGIHLRSKSERIIANMFEENDVPYIYEPALVLHAGKIVYPDFLVLNRRLRKSYVYEHFGTMSDPGYADRTIEKISLYQKNNYFMGINFLFSMESMNRQLDTRSVEKLIWRYLK